MGRVIRHHQTNVQRIDLMHPLVNVPASAHQVGWYTENGRTIGLKLEFPDGHTAHLTYAEIRELKDAAEAFEG